MTIEREVELLEKIVRLQGDMLLSMFGQHLYSYPRGDSFDKAYAQMINLKEFLFTLDADALLDALAKDKEGV